MPFCESFVWRPFRCFKRINAIPPVKITTSRMSPSTKPDMQYPIMKPTIAPPIVPAAQEIYLP